MCMMCDGASHDEVLFSTHAHISRGGWVVVPVYDGPDTFTWAYTIGLAGNFDHPELAVVGLEPEDAGRLLNELGELVRAGHRLADGSVVERVHRRSSGALDVSLAAVDPAHFDRHDTFAAWLDYYGAIGSPYPRPEALQVVLPPWTRCEEHARQDLLLTRPDPLPASMGRNRAARRAAQRRRRRS